METKKRICFLLEKSHLKLTPKEMIEFEKDFLIFKEDLKILDKYNTDNIEPLRQPFEKNENILRDDEIIENNSTCMVNNSSNSKDGYILLTDKRKDNV